jgi:hypothetical protein
MKNLVKVLLLFIAFPAFGQTADEYIQLGIQANKDGNYPSAVKFYSKAIKHGCSG